MLELRKAHAVDLRSLGLDEKWLQARIIDDPAILGLGDLEIAGREHRQPVGGRVDFLMRDVDGETYFEVEVMLGALDESHIVRTIEYWDIERQRRPQFEHRAVIVAEHITARFFNIIRLLNRAVPLLAVKLSAFELDGAVVLHPVTVLDVLEEADISEVDPVEQTDRAFWEKKSNPVSLGVVDKIVNSMVASGLKPRITYNRHHIAVGTSGYNFCWFHPRKTQGHFHMEFRATSETRDAVLSELQSSGIDATPKRSEAVGFSLNATSLEKHISLLTKILVEAEKQSRV